MISSIPTLHPCYNSFALLRRSRTLGVAFVFLAGVTGAGLALAQDANLPKAETILDQYVEAMGGRAAYDKLNNRVTKMTMSLPAQGLTISTTMYATRPDKTYVASEAEMFGKMESGTNGDIVWASNMMTGPQIKEGAERALTLRGAFFDSVAGWQKMFKKVECVGTETIEGKTCYKVVLTPNEDEPETRYFDRESHLLVRTDMNVTTPMGTIPMETYVSDFKKVDDVLYAHKMRVMMMGQERIMTIDSIEHNVDLPPDRFDLPDEVKALVQRQEAEKAKVPAAESEKKPDSDKKPGTDG